MTYKTLHRTLKIEQHEPHKNRWLITVTRKDAQFLFSFYNIIELSKSKNCDDFSIRLWISSKGVAFFFLFYYDIFIGISICSKSVVFLCSFYNHISIYIIEKSQNLNGTNHIHWYLTLTSCITDLRYIIVTSIYNMMIQYHSKQGE